MTEAYETFNLGDWQLQSGEQIKNAHIAYQTFGDPKSPAIVYPTWFSGGEYSKVLFPSLLIKEESAAYLTLNPH